jgi:hypothetical protein
MSVAGDRSLSVLRTSVGSSIAENLCSITRVMLMRRPKTRPFFSRKSRLQPPCCSNVLANWLGDRSPIGTHSSDDIPYFFWHQRASGLSMTNVPAPIPSKSLPMPSDYVCRLDDDQSRPPPGPQLRQPNPQTSIDALEPECLCFRGSLQHDQLMPERDDFRLQHRLAAKAGEKGRKHR